MVSVNLNPNPNPNPNPDPNPNPNPKTSFFKKIKIEPDPDPAFFWHPFLGHGRFTKVIRHYILPQTLLYLIRLRTRQDGFQNHYEV